MKNLEITSEFEQTLKLIEEGHSLFLTGKAGTGKSTLIQHFKKNTKRKVAFLAPTGLAAVNIGGQTIHSFFGFPGRLLDKNEIKKKRNRRVYQELDTIVIDEASMVRADMLDNIDHFLRINGSNHNEPFGGIQMVLVGDLNQLPPVVTESAKPILAMWGYENPFFFEADAWKESYPTIIQLTEVFRQSDEPFLSLLNKIRNREAERDDFTFLNNQHKPIPEDFQAKPYITLSSTNAIAERLNRQRLDELWTSEYVYMAEVSGSFGEKAFPADMKLHLKVGAQVLFCKNDTEEGRWVNGTIGKVVELSTQGIKVSIKNVIEETEVEHWVKPDKWEVYNYDFNAGKNKVEAKSVGSFTQFPLRLAWAITIHKSQGMTFDQVVIDMGRGAFAPGQTYVALSRCRTLAGIILKKPITYKDVMVDENVLEFSARNRLE